MEKGSRGAWGAQAAGRAARSSGGHRVLSKPCRSPLSRPQEECLLLLNKNTLPTFIPRSPSAGSGRRPTQSSFLHLTLAPHPGALRDHTGDLRRGTSPWQLAV